MAAAKIKTSASEWFYGIIKFERIQFTMDNKYTHTHKYKHRLTGSTQKYKYIFICCWLRRFFFESLKNVTKMLSLI